MPQSLPELSLTLGQVLWALNHGREPDKLMKDQVRYLRLLGIPEASTQASPGPGNRIRYDFFDLVELGLALAGLERRFKPGDIAAVLHDDRKRMRNAISAAWSAIANTELDEPWVKSRGRVPSGFAEDLLLRLHDRRNEKWGKLDFLGPEDPEWTGMPLVLIERFEDGTTAELIPLKATMLPWVAWALEAPAIRTGPK